jgi:hypothetical protein
VRYPAGGGRIAALGRWKTSSAVPWLWRRRRSAIRSTRPGAAPGNEVIRRSCQVRDHDGESLLGCSPPSLRGDRHAVLQESQYVRLSGCISRGGSTPPMPTIASDTADREPGVRESMRDPLVAFSTVMSDISMVKPTSHGEHRVSPWMTEGLRRQPGRGDCARTPGCVSLRSGKRLQAGVDTVPRRNTMPRPARTAPLIGVG